MMKARDIHARAVVSKLGEEVRLGGKNRGEK